MSLHRLPVNNIVTVLWSIGMICCRTIPKPPPVDSLVGGEDAMLTKRKQEQEILPRGDSIPNARGVGRMMVGVVTVTFAHVEGTRHGNRRCL